LSCSKLSLPGTQTHIKAALLSKPCCPKPSLPATPTYIKIVLHLKLCCPKLSLPGSQGFYQGRTAFETVLLQNQPACISNLHQTCAALEIVLPQTRPAWNSNFHQTHTALETVLPTLGLPAAQTFIINSHCNRHCAAPNSACLVLRLITKSCCPQHHAAHTRPAWNSNLCQTSSALETVLPKSGLPVTRTFVNHALHSKSYCPKHTLPATYTHTKLALHSKSYCPHSACLELGLSSNSHCTQNCAAHTRPAWNSDLH